MDNLSELYMKEKKCIIVLFLDYISLKWFNSTKSTKNKKRERANLKIKRSNIEQIENLLFKSIYFLIYVSRARTHTHTHTHTHTFPLIYKCIHWQVKKKTTFFFFFILVNIFILL
jgi:hypothetical protein